MPQSLAVLIVEDTQSDALLVARLLKKAGYDLVFERVETAVEMQAALEKQPWDVVISDYKLPQFSGHAALSLLQQTGLDIPFIAVSGAMGEEAAVAMMKAGAHDYVMKDNLGRLLPAVEREIEQARIRRDRRLAGKTIQIKDELLRLTGEIARIGGWEFDAVTLKGTWTDEVARIHDLDPREETNVEMSVGFYVGESRGKINQAIKEAIEQALPYDLELEMISAAGRHKWVRTIGNPEMEDGRVVRVRGIFQDITERKQKEIELQHHREDLELINTLNHLVNKGEGFDRVVATLSQEARRLLNARGCTIYLLSPDGRYITIHNRTLISAPIDKIEQLIGRPMPQIQIPIRSGSHFANILQAEHGTIIHDPEVIQQWMAEFAETTHLPVMARQAVRKFIPQIYALLNIRSLITVPLISEGKCVGLLDLSSQGQFSEEDLQRIHKISGQVTAAILRKQDEELLRASEQKYQSLTEISPVGIFQTDAAGSVTYVNPRWCEISGLSAPQAMGDGWLRAVHAEDRDAIDRLWKNAASNRHPSNSEFRFARPDGSIAWAFYQSIPERDPVGRVTSYVGTVTDITERKHAQQQIETQLRRLGALREIDAAITASLDLNLILNVLLEQTTTQLGMDAACVLLFNPITRTLDYAAGRGFWTRAAEDAHLQLEGSIAGQIVLERRLFHTNEPAKIQASRNFKTFQQDEKIEAYCGIPLIIKDEVKGVLEVYHRQKFDVSPEWTGFLTTLAEQAAIAIDNAQLFENLQNSNKELSRAYDATIEGWSRALDLRDKETEGHTLRVTRITEQMARAAGMSEAELVHIRRGALLHDIGKLGVPDAILLKPDKLSDEEWVMMKKHPQFAYDMLAPISYLRQALDIPYYHHEKWDGSGYPNGLRGEEIPLAARLFAVVDVWDALLSDRPYRQGWPEEKVLEHIRSLAGTHFDPQVVELFIKTIRNHSA